MAEGTLNYGQPMVAYLLLFKSLKEREVSICNVYVVLSCVQNKWGFKTKFMYRVS